MNYKDFNLGDWIGHISGAIEDYRELDGNEMRDLVSFLSKMPKWIPVSERLPKENGHYLITYSYEGTIEAQEAVYVEGEEDKWFDTTDIEITLAVIAWMPLPKPYKAESEDKGCI